MRTLIVVVLGCLLIQGCRKQPELIAPISGRKVQVYFTGHGPSPLVDRLRRSVAYSVEDQGMAIAPDRAGADVTLDGDIEENKRPLKFYYFKCKADAIGPGGISRPIEWSSYTFRAVDVGYDIEKVAEEQFVDELGKQFTSATSVYVGEAKSDGKDIAEQLKSELAGARYKLSSQPDGADIVLKQVQLRTCMVPVSLAQQELTMKVWSRDHAELLPPVSGRQLINQSFSESTAPDLKECIEAARKYDYDYPADAFLDVSHDAAVSVRTLLVAH